MLRILASTPCGRGPVPDLSTAVAVVVDQALRPSRCDIRNTYQDMENGQVSRRWSVNLTTATASESALYRQIETVTGSFAQGKPGHDPTIYIYFNLKLLRELASAIDEHGELLHPEMAKIMILDGSRVPGPIWQVTPLSADHLRLLRGTELTGIDYSVYDYGGQYDSVFGWRLVLLVDGDSGLPVIWRSFPPACMSPGSSWICRCPSCSSSGRTARCTPSSATTSSTPRPPSFRGREGFISIERRAFKGLARGALAYTKDARVRWICKRCNSERTTYALKQIGGEQWPFANDHLWYPIRGAGEHTDMRKVLCLYRNLVESAFAIMKGIGVGGDEPALWAQDLGVVHLIGIHLTLRTARRLAHENGTYALLAAEHAELGLGIKDADPPSNRTMHEIRRNAPGACSGPGRSRIAAAACATDIHCGRCP